MAGAGVRRRGLVLGAGGLGLASPLVARAETWPARPVRVVVPYAPGGLTDLVTRLVAEPLSRRIGQPVVVENRPGANSIVGAGNVAASAPDGYSFAMVIGAHAANATLYRGRMPFDPVADFAPVSHVITAPLILASSARMPMTSLAELLEAARARPGALSYGSSGIGSAAHLTMEALLRQTGVRMEHVPYRGTQPALQDLMAGNIAAMFDVYSAFRPQFEARSIRPIGIAAAERAAFAPEIPTFREMGVADLVYSSWCMLLAPARTPPAVVGRVSSEVAGIVRDPALRPRLVELGFEVAGGTPEEAGRFLGTEIARWGAVIQAANVRVE